MRTTLGAHVAARRGAAAPGVLAAIGLAAVGLAACGGQAGMGGLPRVSDCKIEVLQTYPSSGYIEIGQLSFEVYAAGPARRRYTSPYALANDIHADICSIGGDTLVVDRNAAGVVVRGTVLRRATVYDVPLPPPRPAPRAETCEPSCGPGYACEGGTCIPQCIPACGDGQSCGTDRLCHADE
jgi:hypothetical protein